MIINTAERLRNTKEYYFSTKLAEVARLKEKGNDVINMGIGSPDLAPSQQTIQALNEAASQPNNHGYQPYRGIPQLRKAMARWYKRIYNVDLDADSEILPLMGSKEGIMHISLAFLDPGDEVLIPELGYPTYRAAAQLVQASARSYPLIPEVWEPDFDLMAKQDYSKVKLMWINYPHMPTGKAPNLELFKKIVGFANERKILVCHDNPYSLILNPGKPLSLLSVDGSKTCCLELNSMSKSHNMAGWRIGWLNGAGEYLNEVIKVKSNFDSGMFYGIQRAAIKAFDNSDEWHETQNGIYQERKEIVYRFLDKLECTYSTDQTGLFVWARLPDSVSSAEKFVDHILYQYYLFITPGFIFGPKGNRYIRISLCNHKEILLKGLDRIKNIEIDKIRT